MHRDSGGPGAGRAARTHAPGRSLYSCQSRSESGALRVSVMTRMITSESESWTQARSRYESEHHDIEMLTRENIIVSMSIRGGGAGTFTVIVRLALQ